MHCRRGRRHSTERGICWFLVFLGQSFGYYFQFLSSWPFSNSICPQPSLFVISMLVDSQISISIHFSRNQLFGFEIQIVSHICDVVDLRMEEWVKTRMQCRHGRRDSTQRAICWFIIFLGQSFGYSFQFLLPWPFFNSICPQKSLSAISTLLYS